LTRYIPGKVKEKVWSKYDGKCVYCGSRKDLEFDHIIPYSKGGSNSEKNIQLVCQRCNLIKRDLINDDIVDLRRFKSLDRFKDKDIIIEEFYKLIDSEDYMMISIDIFLELLDTYVNLQEFREFVINSSEDTSPEIRKEKINRTEKVIIEGWSQFKIFNDIFSKKKKKNKS